MLACGYWMVVSRCGVSPSGNPKGAMLTHENVVADAAGVMKAFEVHRKIKEQQPFRSERGLRA